MPHFQLKLYKARIENHAMDQPLSIYLLIVQLVSGPANPFIQALFIDLIVIRNYTAPEIHLRIRRITMDIDIFKDCPVNTTAGSLTL